MLSRYVHVTRRRRLVPGVASEVDRRQAWLLLRGRRHAARRRRLCSLGEGSSRSVSRRIELFECHSNGGCTEKTYWRIDPVVSTYSTHDIGDHLVRLDVRACQQVENAIKEVAHC